MSPPPIDRIRSRLGAGRLAGRLAGWLAGLAGWLASRSRWAVDRMAVSSRRRGMCLLIIKYVFDIFDVLVLTTAVVRLFEYSGHRCNVALWMYLL